MGNKKPEKGETADTSVKAVKVPITKLEKRCLELFGVTSSTFAGATYGLTETEYSVEEMREIINRWLKKEVK